MPEDSPLRFEIAPFEQLALRQFHDIAWLRNVVFVVGQKITAEPEIDGRDPECEHAMLYQGSRLVGTARVFAAEDPQVVGRVAVHPELQGGGLGTKLMEYIQEHLRAQGARAELHAQAHLEVWYTRLGWTRQGEVFVEAEIPHVMMVWSG